jgi:hypothetical protein
MGDDNDKNIGRMEAQIEHIRKTLDEKASLESVQSIKKSLEGRAAREWAIIMTGLGLVATIIIKGLSP